MSLFPALFNVAVDAALILVICPLHEDAANGKSYLCAKVAYNFSLFSFIVFFRNLGYSVLCPQIAIV